MIALLSNYTDANSAESPIEYYSRTKVEALLAENRKQALVEHIEIVQQYGIEGLQFELRRMAEGEKK